MQGKKYNVADAIRNRIDRVLKECGFEMRTRDQYAYYIRGLYASCGARHPGRISTNDIERYIKGLCTFWMRRRAVSALHAYFGGLTERQRIAADPAAPVRMRDIEPKSMTDTDLAARLRRLGWGPMEPRALTWGDLAVWRLTKRPALELIIKRRRLKIDEQSRRELQRRFDAAFPDRVPLRSLQERAGLPVLSTE
jgi:hypothetical protein